MKEDKYSVFNYCNQDFTLGEYVVVDEDASIYRPKGRAVGPANRTIYWGIIRRLENRVVSRYCWVELMAYAKGTDLCSGRGDAMRSQMAVWKEGWPPSIPNILENMWLFEESELWKVKKRPVKDTQTYLDIYVKPPQTTPLESKASASKTQENRSHRFKCCSSCC